MLDVRGWTLEDDRAPERRRTLAAMTTTPPKPARRIAVRAQGLALSPGRPKSVPGVLRRVGAVQLDTISVLARSHELVAYARLGAVGRAGVEQASGASRRRRSSTTRTPTASCRPRRGPGSPFVGCDAVRIDDVRPKRLAAPLRRAVG
jgi:hypothetical protein